MIICKSPAELEKMREASALVAEVLAELVAMVKPGISTFDLDVEAERLVRAAGAEPAFKGYGGYPCTLCASVNEQIIHGIPSKKPLLDGDIVSLDMGVKKHGFFGDSAVTVPVGGVSEEAQLLLRVTQESLEKGIELAKRQGERLVVVNASPGGSQVDPAMADVLEVERIEKLLAASGVDGEFKQFVRGKGPVEEIVEMVDAMQISLLVIGLRKRTPVGKLIMGSVAQDILLSVACPVLAVKGN